MRKKILFGLLSLTVLVASGYGVSKSLQNESGFSGLVLANVEALAQLEFPGEKRCLTDQDKRSGRMNCAANMVEITVYSFSCSGTGSTCVGATGYTGYCLGENISNITMSEKPC